MKERPAGLKLVEFFGNTPLGEEILEGTIGGLMAGASQLGSDQPLGQTALETAAAIAGGIAMGKLGRSIGARLGRRVHPNPLEDQGGALAFVGRLGGMETTAKGLKEQGLVGRDAVKEAIMNMSSADLAREALENPIEFARKYGIEAEQLQAMAPKVSQGRMTAAVLDNLGRMDPKAREELLRQAGLYEKVEKLIQQKAYQDFDGIVGVATKNRNEIGDEVDSVLPGLGDMLSRALKDIDRPTTAITGEHVGRAAGRFIGDEVGILGGLAAGQLLAQQLGMENPKDKQIRELQAQLAQR